MRGVADHHGLAKGQLLGGQLDDPQYDSRRPVPFHRHLVDQCSQFLRTNFGVLARERSQLFLGRSESPKRLIWSAFRRCLINPVQNKVVISLLPFFPSRDTLLRAAKIELWLLDPVKTIYAEWPNSSCCLKSSPVSSTSPTRDPTGRPFITSWLCKMCFRTVLECQPCTCQNVLLQFTHWCFMFPPLQRRHHHLQKVRF